MGQIWYGGNSKEEKFSKSLQAHKDFADSLTKEQLEKLMKPFDNYEVEQSDIHVVRRSSIWCWKWWMSYILALILLGVANWFLHYT
jgi:hypothetical protein